MQYDDDDNNNNIKSNIYNNNSSPFWLLFKLPSYFGDIFKFTLFFSFFV